MHKFTIDVEVDGTLYQAVRARDAVWSRVKRAQDRLKASGIDATSSVTFPREVEPDWTAEDHGPGCDGPLNCTCERSRQVETSGTIRDGEVHWNADEHAGMASPIIAVQEDVTPPGYYVHCSNGKRAGFRQPTAVLAEQERAKWDRVHPDCAPHRVEAHFPSE